MKKLIGVSIALTLGLFIFGMAEKANAFSAGVSSVTTQALPEANATKVHYRRRYGPRYYGPRAYWGPRYGGPRYYGRPYYAAPRYFGYAGPYCRVVCGPYRCFRTCS